jgi:hypothetical protein
MPVFVMRLMRCHCFKGFRSNAIDTIFSMRCRFLEILKCHVSGGSAWAEMRCSTMSGRVVDAME